MTPMGELGRPESGSRPPAQPPGQRGADSRARATPDAPAGKRHEHRPLAEPRSRQEVAQEARTRPVRPDDGPVPDRRDTVAPARDHPGDAARPAPAVAHFHGEFKSHRLDLYTDGNRWAAADSARPEQTTAKKGDAPVRPPAGQELIDGAADNNPSRADRIRSKLYEQSDDALDVLEKNAAIGQSIFDQPPTGSYEGTSAPQPHIYESQPAGIDAGTVATAIFTLGLIIDRAAHRAVEYYEKHAKGDDHAGNR
jgi:hypothetical protein